MNLGESRKAELSGIGLRKNHLKDAQTQKKFMIQENPWVTLIKVTCYCLLYKTQDSLTGVLQKPSITGKLSMLIYHIFQKTHVTSNKMEAKVTQNAFVWNVSLLEITDEASHWLMDFEQSESGFWS